MSAGRSRAKRDFPNRLILALAETAHPSGCRKHFACKPSFAAQSHFHADPFRSRGTPPHHPLPHGKGDHLPGHLRTDGARGRAMLHGIWLGFAFLLPLAAPRAGWRKWFLAFHLRLARRARGDVRSKHLVPLARCPATRRTVHFRRHEAGAEVPCPANACRRRGDVSTQRVFAICLTLRMDDFLRPCIARHRAICPTLNPAPRLDIPFRWVCGALFARRGRHCDQSKSPDDRDLRRISPPLRRIHLASHCCAK